ncbi:MAG: hypothetical protein K0R61_2721 [Microvirga sp.]|jgi:hypothetical protein|nr:hypothetical protein [Microvirga sp.]
MLLSSGGVPVRRHRGSFYDDRLDDSDNDTGYTLDADPTSEGTKH